MDRFELEQKILDCWGICDDLEVLCEGVLDRDMNSDQIANVLIGMKELYHLKFEKTFEIFEHLCRTRQLDPENSWPFPKGSYTNYDRDDDNMNSEP